MSDTAIVWDRGVHRRRRRTGAPARPEAAGAVPVGLPATRGRFGDLLAPLTLSSFRDVVSEVEQKLRIVNQTLWSLELDTRSFERILQEMLGSITAKTRELLDADRATIFLLDAERNELWSIIADGTDGQPLELRIPADQGIAGEAASTGRVINIPRDFYDDPRSAFAQVQDRRNGYRTHSMLTLPLIDGEGRLVAVVQLMNKLVPGAARPGGPEGQLDPIGFSAEDEALLAEFSPTIRLILGELPLLLPGHAEAACCHGPDAGHPIPRPEQPRSPGHPATRHARGPATPPRGSRHALGSSTAPRTSCGPAWSRQAASRANCASRWARGSPGSWPAQGSR